MSVSSTSPASLFGGSWTQLQNRFLLGAGSSYSNGSTGGESTHTLTTSEMPSHTHTPNSNNTSLTGTWVPNVSNGYARGQVAISTSSSKYAPVMDSMDNFVWGTVASTGGGSSHNNMPPYLVVYMWKRTA
jgi:microcystin-dependent protein